MDFSILYFIDLNKRGVSQKKENPHARSGADPFTVIGVMIAVQAHTRVTVEWAKTNGQKRYSTIRYIMSDSPNITVRTRCPSSAIVTSAVDTGSPQVRSRSADTLLL